MVLNPAYLTELCDEINALTEQVLSSNQKETVITKIKNGDSGNALAIYQKDLEDYDLSVYDAMRDVLESCFLIKIPKQEKYILCECVSRTLQHPVICESFQAAQEEMRRRYLATAIDDDKEDIFETHACCEDKNGKEYDWRIFPLSETA